MEKALVVFEKPKENTHIHTQSIGWKLWKRARKCFGWFEKLEKFLCIYSALWDTLSSSGECSREYGKVCFYVIYLLKSLLE